MCGSTDGIPEEELETHIVKMTSTAWYTWFVTPSLQEKDFSFPYGGDAADMKFFPIDKRMLIYVGRNEELAQPLEVLYTKQQQGGITYEAVAKTLPFQEGRCEVWERSIEYNPVDRPNHILNTMSRLTRNLKVDVIRSGPGPNLRFYGKMVASGSERHTRHLPNGINLEFRGWLFEDHGYYVWWWDTPPNSGSQGAAPRAARARSQR